MSLSALSVQWVHKDIKHVFFILHICAALSLFQTCAEMRKRRTLCKHKASKEHSVIKAECIQCVSNITTKGVCLPICVELYTEYFYFFNLRIFENHV